MSRASRKKRTAGQKKYNRYTRQQRLNLIEMVFQQGKSKTSSAKALKICQTSARLILDTWEKQGRIFEKKSEREKRERREAQRQKKIQEKEKKQREKMRRRAPKIEEPESEPVVVKKEEKEKENVERPVNSQAQSQAPSSVEVTAENPFQMCYWMVPPSYYHPYYSYVPMPWPVPQQYLD